MNLAQVSQTNGRQMRDASFHFFGDIGIVGKLHQGGFHAYLIEYLLQTKISIFPRAAMKTERPRAFQWEPQRGIQQDKDALFVNDRN